MAEKTILEQKIARGEEPDWADFAASKTLKEAQIQRVHELRSIAIHALDYGIGNIPLWDYFGELKTIKIPRYLYGVKFEARIALLLAGKVRQAQVIGTINNLRNFREKRDQMDEFRTFEAYFKERMSGALTNHSFGATTFQQIDHTPVWDTIKQHIDFLKARGHEVFLNSGTLLGVVRDGKLIDHDDDVDLAVVLKASSMRDTAQEWKALTTALQDGGILDEDAFDNPAIIKLTRIGEVQVDLFPAWFEGDDLFVYPHTSGQLQRADLLPLKPCKITGNPIPAEPEKMLAQNYGESWNVPNPYFKFPWPQSREIFRQFLDAL